MNKALMSFLAVGASVAVFGAFHRAAKQTRAAVAVTENLSRASATRLASSDTEVEALRSVVSQKQDRLRLASRRAGISPEVLSFLEGCATNGMAERSASRQEAVTALAAEQAQKSRFLAQLRQELDIGWETSPDYLLVGKEALKQVNFRRLDGATHATALCGDLLALSRDEQSALETAIRHAKDANWLEAQRTEPTGDVVAQYSVPPPDPAFEQSLSNCFATEVVSAVGPGRTDLLLPQAWNELRSDVAPTAVEVMTIRRSVTDGEPDLVCEMNRGGRVDSTAVRYAHYPSGWFLKVFPGGWETLARREGFELPRSFRP